MRGTCAKQAPTRPLVAVALVSGAHCLSQLLGVLQRLRIREGARGGRAAAQPPGAAGARLPQLGRGRSAQDEPPGSQGAAGQCNDGVSCCPPGSVVRCHYTVVAACDIHSASQWQNRSEMQIQIWKESSPRASQGRGMWHTPEGGNAPVKRFSSFIQHKGLVGDVAGQPGLCSWRAGRSALPMRAREQQEAAAAGVPGAARQRSRVGRDREAGEPVLQGCRQEGGRGGGPVRAARRAALALQALHASGDAPPHWPLLSRRFKYDFANSRWVRVKPERDADGALAAPCLALGCRRCLRAAPCHEHRVFLSARLCSVRSSRAGKYTSENWEKGDATVITPKSGTPYTVAPWPGAAPPLCCGRVTQSPTLSPAPGAAGVAGHPCQAHQARPEQRAAQ